MDKETLEIVGSLVLPLIWVFWRVGWKFENIARWDSLPLWERLMAVVIMVGLFGLVESVALVQQHVIIVRKVARVDGATRHRGQFGVKNDVNLSSVSEAKRSWSRQDATLCAKTNPCSPARNPCGNLAPQGICSGSLSSPSSGTGVRQ